LESEIKEISEMEAQCFCSSDCNDLSTYTHHIDLDMSSGTLYVEMQDSYNRGPEYISILDIPRDAIVDYVAKSIDIDYCIDLMSAYAIEDDEERKEKIADLEIEKEREQHAGQYEGIYTYCDPYDIYYGIDGENKDEIIGQLRAGKTPEEMIKKYGLGEYPEGCCERYQAIKFFEDAIDEHGPDGWANE